jgi:transmembrane sensor
MNPNQEVERALAHQASEWVTVLSRKASRDELAAFAEWLKTSPRHVRDFLVMAAIEQELHRVDACQFEAEDLSTAALSNVLTLKEAPQRAQARFQARKWAIAAAAAVISVAAGAIAWQQGHFGDRQNYETQVGEQRVVELADGSTVHLNTHSRIKVRFSDEGRDIELLAGEVLFKVQSDPKRPFRVHSQDTIIQAVGTQFNVYRRSQGITVSVLEGKVALTHERPVKGTAREELAAGEQARIAANGRILKQATPDLSKAVAWRQRRLVFDQDSLGDMVREFNRYNKTPQFRLEGAGVEMRHYTGVFDADDPESLIQLLSAEADLAVERSGDVIVVRGR